MRKATELVPSSANAWSNLGGVLQMSGDFDGALEAFRRSLQLEPSKEAYSNLGTTLYYLGRFTEAVGNFERAAELGPYDYTVQGNLADALWQVPDGRADAVARYQRASLLAEKQLEATPGDPVLRAQLGFFYGRIGDGERSRRYLSEALGAGPELLYVQYFAGVAAADRERPTAALRAVAELVRLGYPPSLLRTAPEFRGLLQDAEYRKIIGGGMKVNHAMSDDAGLSPFERLLSLVTRMRPGEGRAAFLFFLHGFLLLSSYQVVKALREAFMLTKFSAETRSYAVAVDGAGADVRGARCTAGSAGTSTARACCAQ